MVVVGLLREEAGVRRVEMEDMDEEELEELLERTCEVVSAIDEDGNGCVRTHSSTQSSVTWVWPRA